MSSNVSGRSQSPPPGGAAAAVSRRHPMILKDPTRPTAVFAEAAGDTAAGCAAICCCCTCGLLDLIVLTAVRLPAGLCRKALRKKRMKRRVAGQKGSAAPPRVAAESDDEGNVGMSPATAVKEAAAAVAEKEREMWAEFQNSGFGRSPSQREELHCS